MKKILSILALAAAVALPGQSAYAQLPSKPYLHGLWQGEMTVVPQDADKPMVEPFDGQKFNFRLDIKDTNLVMYLQNGPDSWVGIGEGADLRLNQAERSAIVIAALAQGDPTETWMLNITRWNEENIAVFLTQVVSPADSGEPARPFLAYGQMQRMSQ